MRMAAIGKNSAHGAGAAPDVAALLEDADRDRRMAQNTRRVVLASLGVIKDQDAGRKRTRSLALAATLVLLLVVGPLLWHAVDNLSSGDTLGDLGSQFSLWVCILCPALLSVALIAGWLRKK